MGRKLPLLVPCRWAGGGCLPLLAGGARGGCGRLAGARSFLEPKRGLIFFCTQEQHVDGGASQRAREGGQPLNLSGSWSKNCPRKLHLSGLCHSPPPSPASSWTWPVPTLAHCVAGRYI